MKLRHWLSKRNRLVFFLWSLAFAGSLHAAQQRYALIVGANDGGVAVQKLRYAQNDAAKFRELLEDIGNFEKQNITLLNQPDRQTFESAFKAIASRIRSSSANDALFLFYYSGHANGRNLLLGKHEFPIDKIKSYLGSTGATVSVAVFDACQSGVVTQFKGGKQVEPFFFQNNQPVRGEVIIASSAATELAQESSSLKGSIFSHHWFNGLRGSADLSGDRKVSLTEAYKYAYRKTIETTALISGQIQHPVYRFNIQGQDEVVLTDLNVPSSGIKFGSDFLGKFLILSDDYINVYADFFKSKNDVFIALLPGKYTTINVRGDSTLVHSFEIGVKSIYVPRMSAFVLNPYRTTILKGSDKQSFDNPAKSGVSQRLGPGLGGVFHTGTRERSDHPLPVLDLAYSRPLDHRLSFFAEMGLIIPEQEFTGLAGIDFYGSTSQYESFIGLGAGISSAAGQSDQINAGLSLIARIGIVKDISPMVQLQVLLPYVVELNRDFDSRVGLSVRLLFGLDQK